MGKPGDDIYKSVLAPALGNSDFVCEGAVFLPYHGIPRIGSLFNDTYNVVLQIINFCNNPRHTCLPSQTVKDYANRFLSHAENPISELTTAVQNLVEKDPSERTADQNFFVTMIAPLDPPFHRPGILDEAILGIARECAHDYRDMISKLYPLYYIESHSESEATIRAKNNAADIAIYKNFFSCMDWVAEQMDPWGKSITVLLVPVLFIYSLGLVKCYDGELDVIIQKISKLKDRGVSECETATAAAGNIGKLDQTIMLAAQQFADAVRKKVNPFEAINNIFLECQKSAAEQMDPYSELIAASLVPALFIYSLECVQNFEGEFNVISQTILEFATSDERLADPDLQSALIMNRIGQRAAESAATAAAYQEKNAVAAYLLSSDEAAVRRAADEIQEELKAQIQRTSIKIRQFALAHWELLRAMPPRLRAPTFLGYALKPGVTEACALGRAAVAVDAGNIQKIIDLCSASNNDFSHCDDLELPVVQNHVNSFVALYKNNPESKLISAFRDLLNREPKDQTNDQRAFLRRVEETLGQQGYAELIDRLFATLPPQP